MSSYFVCCEKCLAHIAFHSTSAAKFWMDLCNLRIKRGEYVILRGEESEELALLEKQGFIITTDMPHHIGIHITGHMMTEEGEDFFCVRQGNHE